MRIWANRRVIDALETLANVPPRAITLMSHVLTAQQVWLGRVERELVAVPVWEDMPLNWMSETAERQHRKLVSYAASLSETDLRQSIDYTNLKGIDHRNTPLDILTHLSHHAAYHRGQIVQIIRPLLPDAPITDFNVWAQT